jgi:hypothetical protein
LDGARRVRATSKAVGEAVAALDKRTCDDSDINLAQPKSLPSTITTVRDVFAFFEGARLRTDEIAYLRFHTARYLYLLRFIEDVIGFTTPTLGPRPLRILDIGPAFQTALMRTYLPGAEVNTLGLQRADEEYGEFMTSVLTGGRHWTVDLNESANREGWPVIPEHDVVIMAEVVEHLYTAPELVLRTVSMFLCESGYLVLQTPNACALHKRLKMLVGRHPFGPIEEWRQGSHFREYTMKELAQLSLQVGLTPIRVEAANYFRRDTALSDVYNAIGKFLPPSLRAGITMALRKSGAGDGEPSVGAGKAKTSCKR